MTQDRRELRLYQVFPSVFGEDAHDPVTFSPNLVCSKPESQLFCSRL